MCMCMKGGERKRKFYRFITLNSRDRINVTRMARVPVQVQVWNSLGPKLYRLIRSVHSVELSNVSKI